MSWQFDGLDEGLRYLRFGVRALLTITGIILAAFLVYVVARVCWEAVVYLERHAW